MPGERRSLRNLFNRRTHRRNQTLDLVPAPPPSQQEIKDEQSFFRRIFGCCFPFVLRRQAPAARAPPPVPPPTPSAESGASLATAASPVEEPVDHQFLKTRKPKVRPVVATLNLSLPKSPINMLKESAPAMTLVKKEEEEVVTPTLQKVPTSDIPLLTMDSSTPSVDVQLPVMELSEITGEAMPSFGLSCNASNEFEDEETRLQADIDEIFRIVPSAPGAKPLCYRFSPKKVCSSPSEKSENEKDLFWKRSPSVDSLDSVCNGIFELIASGSKTDPTVEYNRVNNMTPLERLEDMLPPFRVCLSGRVNPFPASCNNEPNFYRKTFLSTIFAGSFAGNNGLDLQPVIFKGSQSTRSERKLRIEARVMQLFVNNDKFLKIHGSVNDVTNRHHRLGDFALITEFVGNEESHLSYTLDEVCVSMKIEIGFSRITAIKMGIDIAHALRSMHMAGLLHCNLTCKSVLIKPNEPRYTVKIIKLGNTCLIDAPIGLDIKHSGIKTNPFTIVNEIEDDFAPELYQQGALPSIKTDVYSLGTILYELGSFGYVASMKRLGKECMRQKPEDRPSLETVIATMKNTLRPGAARGPRTRPNGPKTLG